MSNKEKLKNQIALNIKYYRKKAGITQKQLAELVGVTSTAVSNWESGQNSINTEILFKVCEVMNVSLNDIYSATPSASLDQQKKTTPEDGLSENKRKLIEFARNVPEDKAELLLRIMKSILEDGG
jgi:transcriptional regulator with XRE-family HTH domain